MGLNKQKKTYKWCDEKSIGRNVWYKDPGIVRCPTCRKRLRASRHNLEPMASYPEYVYYLGEHKTNK